MGKYHDPVETATAIPTTSPSFLKTPEPFDFKEGSRVSKSIAISSNDRKSGCSV
jgi:hypothetical protein